MLTRRVSRPLLFLGLLVFLSNANGADAFFGGLISSLIGQVQNQVQQIVQEVQTTVQETVQQTFDKVSVLTNFFGNGVFREDLSLPEIFGNVFSRNNSIFIANSTSVDSDWQLGDGTGLIGAVANGGTVGVFASGNGGVSATLGSSPGAADANSSAPTPVVTPSPSPTPSKSPIPMADDEGPDVVPMYTPEAEVNVTVPDSGQDEAMLELMGDWEAFVTSSIWDLQDGEPSPEPSSEDEKLGDSLETSSRIITGVFLANRFASGAPFSVRFFYNNEENFYCSGSLVGYPYVLTAAHCGVVEGDEVRVGGRLLRSGYKAVVASVTNHPSFDRKTLAHDVAVVRLDSLVAKEELNENGVKAAVLNNRTTFPEKNFVGVVSGHGSVVLDGKGASDELLSTRHTTYALDKCQSEITQGEISDNDSYLCVGDGDRSTTCVGDSGAGLWWYRTNKNEKGNMTGAYEVYGVVSFGEVTDEALCPLGPPSVFQRVSVNLEWIEKVVGKENMEELP